MNTESGIFSTFERDELNKITAKSILEKLMNNRQSIDVEFTARRLIWELMQNSKDNASLCNEDDEEVDVTIEITENRFIFSHNKGYFTNEHIRGLIRKYSSSDKDRNAEQIGQHYKTTGRFGTGFMTTHLLSEKVKVESYYRNDDETFKKFSFWLDRTGKSVPKIVDGINSAFEEAEINIKRSQGEILTKRDFKTSFFYPLTDQKKKLARIASEEVQKGIAYTLINVPQVNSVAVDEELIGRIVYSVKSTIVIRHREHEFFVYNLLMNGEESKFYYLTIGDDEIRIIIPISCNGDKYHVLELDASIPRLHLDFPMIGTEDLNLPFIVNSPLFEPTETRDGVSLINDDENDISQMNCGIVLKAVALYKLFLSYVGGAHHWEDLYNLARVKSPKRYSWIDADWFKSNVIDSIREKVLHTSLVAVASGDRISIWNENDECQVCFPYAVKSSVREKLSELARKAYPQLVPIKEHIDQWYEIIWGDCYKFSLDELSKDIHGRGNLINLAESINGNVIHAIAFLNEYYELLNLEGNHIKDILSDKFSVIANQLGSFRKKNELYIDVSIDEEIKNACLLISKDPREYLIDKEIHTGDGITFFSKRQDDIITEINSIIKENKHGNISSVCDYLASLLPQDNISQKRLSIYEFSRMVYPDDFVEKREINHYDDKIWEESDKKSLFYIVSKISSFETVKSASRELGFDDEKEFIHWLDTLVSFLVKEGFQNSINKEDDPILPNQNGVFCKKDNLFLDEGDISEELKDISEELGHDFRRELLHISIFLELPENRTYNIGNVAEKISASVKPILRDVDKRKEYRDTLKKLYLWMNENKDEADRHFSDLFERRFLFLEDDDISLNMRKATEFDQLLEEHGIKSIEELRVKLSSLGENKSGDDSEGETGKINITKEILVSLGISSQSELEEAFKDPAISSRFYHTSTPTTDMFIYAQKLIERAKKNIKERLQELPEYDCTDIEETAPTILAGILKNGVPIHIVTRPSDNGEVIIYYSSEKDTLDSDNSELWIDNGIKEPHILTLGRILKSTGINKIPINMN